MPQHFIEGSIIRRPLYWLAASAGVAANWRVLDSWKNTSKDRRFLTGAGLLAATGLYLSVRPFLKQRYDEEIIEHLHQVGDFYGYQPGLGSLLASAH